ncbi:MAG: PQQ-binding-like beta-propeller repeat protein, partial [Acidimicrobiia bacterium]
ALHGGFLYVATHGGELLAVRTSTGEVTWSDTIGWHAWSSPLVVDGQLVVSVNCGGGGGLRGYRLTNPAHPVVAWEMDLHAGCIESTPAIWKGRIYVGDRAGFFYAFGDAAAEAAGRLGLGS